MGKQVENKEINTNNKKIEENPTIDEVLEKKKKRRTIRIILIIFIILLMIIFWLLGYKMGKIGFGTEDVSTNPNEKVAIIKVMQGDVEITKDTELEIFRNVKFDGEKIIAPQSSGTYQFCISNEVENDITYSIKFTDEMKNFVNMKYRLKIDNIYIKGTKDTYVGIDELSVDNITVLKNSNNIFTLEWYWEDSDIEDTYVGSQESDQHYTLKLEINSEILERRKK